MRYIGIDVHRDFCEVCVRDERGGESRRRVATRPAELERFAAELGAEDYVALEVSGPTGAVARILEPRVGRVVVVSPRRLGQSGGPGQERPGRCPHARAPAGGGRPHRGVDAG